MSQSRSATRPWSGVRRVGGGLSRCGDVWAGWLVMALVVALAATGVTPAARAAAPAPYLAVDGGALDGATLVAPFTADLVNAEGIFGTVKFLLDDAYVGQDTATPYRWTVEAGPGLHKLKARWDDTSGTPQSVDAHFTIKAADPKDLVYAEPGPAKRSLWVTGDNRRTPISGLYDWSKAGFGGGATLPSLVNVRPEAQCRITAEELANSFGVVPNDGADDTVGLQGAIDRIKTTCSASGDYTKLSVISLPAGVLDVSHEISVDADYLLIRGAGSDPRTGTRIVFRPDANTRYDSLSADGSRWDPDGMSYGSANGGWLWPGRGLFRVQSRGVHPDYATEYAAAPANRKDLFEGTVNVHWKVGAKLRAKPCDPGFSARKGDKVVHLATDAVMDNFRVGGLVNVRAANSMRFYESMQVFPTTYQLDNLHMRQQIFMVTAGDLVAKTLTLDKPLEYDLPIDSVSDGSEPINGATFASKVSPLVDAVVGVGFENLSFTQDMPGLDRAKARYNYGNMAPAAAMHGIVFKWAANSWVRGVRADMTGSHPIVTEEAANLSIVDNYLDGAWNKGRGGNGYFRGSRVWDSLYAGNTTRNLRHFTFQWSAAGNVAIGNSFDSDLNLHGGYERNNLFELNEVAVPYAHRPGSCESNCGDEGGTTQDSSDWYPIWWAAGKKAVKWSGSSGPRNVFFNNHLSKQLGNSTTAYQPYYGDRRRVYQFGWDGTAFRHLDVGGTPIADWAGNETRDYSGGHGVDSSKTDPGQSLFLRQVSLTGYAGPRPQRLQQTWGCWCWDGRDMVNTRLAADPVNTATGGLMETFSDLEIPGVGRMIDWGRTYNSQDTTDGPYGPGWTFDANSTLAYDPADGSYTLRNGSGGQSRYTRNADGTYSAADPAITAMLSDRAGGGWVLRNLDRDELHFDTTGRLVADRDDQGRGITLAYTDGRLSTLTDAVGQTLTVTWGTAGAADGRIVEVTSSDGRSVSYGYTPAAGKARLTSVTGVDGQTTTYSYDAAGYLNGITDPTGKTSARTTYDPATGRVVEQADAAGAVTRFAWDPDTQTATVTDPAGTVRQDVYQGNVLVSQVGGDGRASSVYYDTNNHPVAENTAGQQLTRSTYDARGNLTRRTMPAAVDDDAPAESWTYDSANRVTNHTDVRGAETTYAYDAAGRLITLTAADGGTTTYTYTPLGQVATVTDPLGRMTRYEYSPTGDLTKQTSPSGAVTTMTYDAAHRMTSRTDPRGNITGADLAAFTTRWTYDAAGRLLSTTDPLNRVTTHTYDAAGRLTSTTDPGNGVTRWTYDAAGRLLSTTDPLNRVTTHTYDAAGRLTSTAGPDGAKTTYTYDEAGRVATVTAPKGNVAGADAETVRRHTTSYAYDAAGRLSQVRSVDPASPAEYLVVRTGYDAADRPTTVTDPTGATTTTGYDPAGNVTKTTDPTGVVAAYGYDTVGRPTTVTAGGTTTTSEYDAAGQMVRSTTESGNTTTFTYTADGQLATTVDPRGNVTGASPADYTTSYGYDPAGQPTTVTDPLGRVTTTTYDGAGQVTKVTNPAGKATTYAYSPLGDTTTITSPNAGVTTWSYDAAGQPTGVKGPRGYGPSFTYDPAGRAATFRTEEDRTTSYRYDPNGNPTTVELPTGATTPAAGDGTITTTYDHLDRPIAVDYSDASPDLAYRYDQAGRVVEASATGLAGTTTTTTGYDPAGRPTMVARRGPGEGTSAYTYDAHGRPATTTLPDGRTQTWRYDTDARLAGAVWAEPGGASTDVAYGYTPVGQLSTTTAQGGPTTTRAYDRAGQLTRLTHTQAGQTLVDHTVAYNPVGAPTRVTTTRGTTTTSALYSYNLDDRVSKICRPAAGTTCDAAAPSWSYVYDKSGNRTRLTPANTADNTVVATTYDKDDRPTSDTAGTTVTATHRYDDNGALAGQTTSAGTRTYTYTLDARLASATLEDGRQVNYRYDADGQRTQRSVDSTVDATWAWHTPVGGLSTRVSETNGAGTATHRWWPDPTSGLGSATATGTAGGSLGWLLADPTATVTDTAAGGGLAGGGVFDPFGYPLQPSTGGFADNPLRFHGQYQDAVTGLYDLRARDYTAAAGRFTAADPHPLTPGTPYAQTYRYADNRPTTLSDPTGQCPWCIVGGGLLGAAFGAVDCMVNHHGCVKSILVGAGTGALSAATLGAAGTLGLGAAATLAVDATVGALSYATYTSTLHAWEGQPYTWPDAGRDLATGATVGVLGAGAGLAFGRAGTAFHPRPTRLSRTGTAVRAHGSTPPHPPHRQRTPPHQQQDRMPQYLGRHAERC